MNVKSFFTKRWFSDRVSRFRGLPLWCTVEIEVDFGRVT